jgi:hypothetical protein
MHDENDPEIEYSPLCEEVTQDGLTVRVQIYRLKTGSNGCHWRSLIMKMHRRFGTIFLRPIMRL